MEITNQLEVGNFIYIETEYGQRLIRKVVWKNEYYFEWNGGWSTIEELKTNEDKTSKVKFILNN